MPSIQNSGKGPLNATFQQRLESALSNLETGTNNERWNRFQDKKSHVTDRHVYVTQQKADQRVIQGYRTGATVFPSFEATLRCFLTFINTKKHQIAKAYANGDPFTFSDTITLTPKGIKKLFGDEQDAFEGLRYNREIGKFEIAQTRCLTAAFESSDMLESGIRNTTMYPNLFGQTAEVLPNADVRTRIRSNLIYQKLSPLNRAWVDEALSDKHKGFMLYMPRSNKRGQSMPECIELRMPNKDGKTANRVRIRVYDLTQTKDRPAAHKLVVNADCIDLNTGKVNNDLTMKLTDPYKTLVLRHGYQRSRQTNLAQYQDVFLKFQKDNPVLGNAMLRIMNTFAAQDNKALIGALGVQPLRQMHAEIPNINTRQSESTPEK